MNLAAHHQEGVPTTPPPQKPAPNPRYNDLTRPRSLHLDAEHQQVRQAQTSSVGWRGHFWGSAPDGQLVQQQQQQQQQWPGPSTDDATLNLCRSTNGSGAVRSSFSEQQRRTPSSSSDPDFPLPWQGKIDLPASDEEIMNAAQTWIMQILHDNGGNFSDDDAINSSADVLLDGRLLCRVANGIAAGSVEAAFEDESDNTRNLCSFLVACRRLGVPAGALFDIVEPDPRRVGLCLHVLSAVVRDTVPEFVGPFLGTRLSGCSSPIIIADDSGEDGDDDGGGGDDGPKNSSNESNQRHHQHHRHHHNGMSEEEAGPGIGPQTAQKWPSRQTAAAPAEDVDFSPSADEIDNECHQHFQQQQQDYQQRYQNYHRQHHEPRPPLPPAARPRPLSLPSRFSPASPTDEDAMWNSLFPSPASLARAGGAATPLGGRGDGGGGEEGGYRDAAVGVAWCATEERVERSPLGQSGTSESFKIAALHPTAAAAAAGLSAWLSNLNLGAFEGALVSIGVETMGDLRYLEDQDLYTIGMHGPQVRKLLQNRP